MEIKRFTKNDSGFVCANCSKNVSPLNYTSRNHCPFCLHSLHLDINPGDRLNNCEGLLVPISTAPNLKSKKGELNYVINFKCAKCGQLMRNKSAIDDNNALLIRLTNVDYANIKNP